MLESHPPRIEYLFMQIDSTRGLYRGYPLASLIAVLHLNIYASVRALWEQARREGSEIEQLLLSKEAVGAFAALLVLHPLDTIKYKLNHIGRIYS